jgi:pyruvate/2-oxoglutarate/acetoin dehydrogenase E1 component
LPFNKYLEFLGNIDIAIFAHNRQQSMGNIITLLGLGKKVYIKNDITSWEHFKNINVQVFDIASINLEILDEQVIYNNIQKIKEYYSESNLKAQLEIIFKI